MDELESTAKTKEIECRVKSKAYSIWLTTLLPANLVLVVGGSLISLVAGSSLLIEQDIISPKFAGILALISAGFTIIHSKLNCDQHQSECKKLKNLYEGLGEDYSNLQTIADEDEFRAKLDSLNAELSHVIKSTGAEPSDAALKKARNYYA